MPASLPAFPLLVGLELTEVRFGTWAESIIAGRLTRHAFHYHRNFFIVVFISGFGVSGMRQLRLCVSPIIAGRLTDNRLHHRFFTPLISPSIISCRYIYRLRYEYGIILLYSIV